MIRDDAVLTNEPLRYPDEFVRHKILDILGDLYLLGRPLILQEQNSVPGLANRMLARWANVELIVIDELGYVPLAEVAAELLFQVIADRAEKAAVIVTTNLPFSEWPQVFTNARLCKAVLDRLTDQAHIIETGSASYR